jgi:NAD(P)-dependent dehydrogenase (short-subunit alcohol dehydrogenase family)
MSGLLDNKVAIITGAASGIGESTTKLFAAEGARVLAVDLREGDLATVHAQTPGAVIMEQDVTVKNAAQAIVSKALECFGQLDILFNNAGTVGNWGEIETYDDTNWDFVFELNISSMYRLCKAAIPELKKSNAGRIINVGSIRSEFADTGVAAYTASKHAVAGLTKTLACELGGYHCTANYIQPGAIVTGLTQEAFDTEYGEYWKQLAPTGRLGQAEEVANAVIYLASDEASFVNGTGLFIDGGASIHV